MFRIFTFIVLAYSANVCSALNAENSQSVGHTYLLSPFDKLIISVYGQDDLQSEQRISDQGAISMPLLGDVTIGGLPVFEAQKLLEEAFVNQRYLVKPVVTISIEEFSPKVVTVLGEVESPGSIVIPQGRNGIPIQIAIAQAGGFTGAAQKADVKVTRTLTGAGQTDEVSFDVDVAAILQASGKSKAEQLFLALPDDIIFVPRRLF
ncbi:polysaccharide biosynthesis/export family protein [Coraliomargarita sp. SDUM461003]|uniref:Polysaccharide biosynthesis/export family protein n=1 Tax=Thalassobacterium maritimum TaxID=3041265 RepID=A0ABU1AVN8_9BACT|nr:polysaccharide biosynthesis/export family protein [Coraliomargarita sp. SDUM461003]MDQ8208210.1 polysaccharide biosynthesis/export family protein [Coraliomargarita sp. SDUM461003]